MSRLGWDVTGEHLFETGVEHVALYPYNKTSKAYGKGVAWNGVTGVTETPSGAEATALYADNIKYLNLYSNEEFAATITAYTYPDEFAILDGSAEIAQGARIGQQARGMFGLVFETKIGNDTDGNDHANKLHIIYGAQATPSERAFSTINDSPEAIEFSWELNTTPIAVSGFKPTSIITVDSSKCASGKYDALKDYLFGKDADPEHSVEASDPTLALPDKVLEILGAPAQG